MQQSALCGRAAAGGAGAEEVGRRRLQAGRAPPGHLPVMLSTLESWLGG